MQVYSSKEKHQRSRKTKALDKISEESSVNSSFANEMPPAINSSHISNFNKIESERDKQIFNDEAQELLSNRDIQINNEEMKQ